MQELQHDVQCLLADAPHFLAALCVSCCAFLVLCSSPVLHNTLAGHCTTVLCCKELLLFHVYANNELSVTWLSCGCSTSTLDSRLLHQVLKLMLAKYCDFCIQRWFTSHCACCWCTILMLTILCVGNMLCSCYTWGQL